MSDRAFYQQQDQGLGEQEEVQNRTDEPQMKPQSFQSIAMQDWYRKSDPATRQKVKEAWLQGIAPRMYPQMQRDPRTQMQVREQIYNFQVPDFVKGEEQIVRPDTMDMRAFKKIQNNPEFARMPYKKQQQLKEVWFMKMASQDPDFQKMSQEEQRAYYENLMKSAPSFAPGLDGSRRKSGLVTYFDEDKRRLTRDDISAMEQGLTRFNSNLMTSFIDSFGSLITGPIRAITGEDSAISQTLANIHKEQNWINSITAEDTSNFLTGTLPTLGGTFAGLALGPYATFEKMLAGGVRSVASGAKLKKFPGLIDRATKKAGVTGADFTASVTGGALAGAVQGIAQSLAEGKHWSTYIAQDATIGVGFEIASRYVGMLREARKAAKSLGMSHKEFIEAADKIQKGEQLTPEMQEAFKANPEMQMFTQSLKQASKYGLSTDLMESVEGVRMEAQVLGFGVNKTDDALEIRKEGKTVAKFTGPEENQISQAIEWLDNNEAAWRAWEKSRPAKSLMEGLETQPEISVRKGRKFPQAAREELVQFLDEYEIAKGADPKLDPRAETAKLDEMVDIVQRKSKPKAAEELARRGVIFDSDPETNVAAIEQLKARLEKVQPTTPYIITNTKTNKLVKSQNVPAFLTEHPDIKQPFLTNRVLAGKPSEIRNYLNTVKKNITTQASQEGRVAKQGNISLYKFTETDPVEMHTKVPDEQGELHDAILHFPTLKQARNAMNQAKARGMDHMINEVANWKGSKQFRESFRQFEKNLRYTNPEKYRNDFLPYEYLSMVAQQQNYFLGNIKGKYILEDVLSEEKSWREFDNLQQVASFLRDPDTRRMRPEFSGVTSRDGFERMQETEHGDPITQVEYLRTKTKKKFGVLDAFRYKFQPTKYFMQQAERNASVKQVRERWGFSPVRFYNAVQDMTRAENAWTQQWMARANKIKKGLRKKDNPYLWRYIQGFDNRQEYDAAQDLDKTVNYELKEDVYNDMVRDLGQQRADFLVEKGRQVHNFFDDLFKESNLPWNTYVKNYLPHISQQMSKGEPGVPGGRTDYRRFENIPHADRREFFELMRETDMADVIWNDNVSELMDIYTQLMGRKKFVRPTMQKAGDELRRINNEIRKMSEQELQEKGISQGDWQMIARYTADVMQTIEGVRGETDAIFSYAAAKTMDEVKSAVQKGLKMGETPSKGSRDIVGNLIKLSVGSHLAARPYPVVRDLTQSIIAGGSLIGNRFWLEGVGRLQTPGAMKHLMSTGVLDTKHMPVGGGYVKAQGKDPISLGMVPYQMSDWINRGVMWYGMDARVQEAIDKFKAGQITQDQFLKQSGARLFSKENFNEIADILNRTRDKDQALATVKDRLKRLAVEESQFLYNKFDQPQAFRSGIGRMAGQYTSWPNTFFNFLTSRATRGTAMTPTERLGFFTRVGTSVGAVAAGLYSAGLDPYGFLPWNMLLMSPGPYFSLLTEGIQGVNGDRAAWGNFVRNLVSIVPFSYAGEGVVRSIRAFEEGQMYEGIMHLADAPIRQEVYPKREVGTDLLEKRLKEAGDKYINWRQKPLSEKFD